jgi:3-dehydroquinate dehydratase type I
MDMICVSLSPASNEEALARMREAFTLVDIVELRIDGIKDVDLDQLLSSRRKKVIVTNRSRREGGKFRGGENERIALLKQAARLGAEYVDVELNTSPLLRKEIRLVIDGTLGRTRLILSWHDMKKTPSERMLMARLDRCREGGADLAKIVPYAVTDADNLKILNLIIHAKESGQDIIAFCMGPRGRVSRAVAPSLGSRISYVALTAAEKTAPGQLTFAEMHQFTRILTGEDEDSKHDLCTLRKSRRA